MSFSYETWTVNFDQFDALTDAMDEYGRGAGYVVQDYLYKEGYHSIASHIPALIHPSGRRWKRHRTSATEAPYAAVFEGWVQGMSLTVKSKSYRNYLYFPDDGSNTERHAGGQHFMLRAAIDQTEDIVNGLVGRLVQNFKEV